MSQLVAGYEVLRSFSGSPEVGQIIDVRDVRPENAANLVERRFLRAIPMGGGRVQEERADWAETLRPYEAIETPEQAPSGSGLHHLLEAARAATDAAAPLVDRAAALRRQLDAAEAAIAAAEEHATWSKVAARMAEREVCTRVWREIDAQATAATATATETEAALGQGWHQVVSAREALARLIAGTDGDDLTVTKVSSRWVMCWRILRDLLDVPGHEAA